MVLAAELSGLWSGLLSVVPAGAAVVAALLAARSARQSKAAEIESSRTRELESRLAEQRYVVYEPLIKLLRDMLDGKDLDADGLFKEKLSEFTAWLNVFGSDEAVMAFGRFMQGAYHDAPPTLLMRLYADFLLAARRDMGDPRSDLTRTEVLSSRIRDIYQNDGFREAMILPFDELVLREGWTPPWA